MIIIVVAGKATEEALTTLKNDDINWVDNTVAINAMDNDNKKDTSFDPNEKASSSMNADKSKYDDDAATERQGCDGSPTAVTRNDTNLDQNDANAPLPKAVFNDNCIVNNDATPTNNTVMSILKYDRFHMCRHSK